VCSALKEALDFTSSPLEGAKEKSYEIESEGKGKSKKMITRMNNVNDSLEGFGSCKVKRKGETKPNWRIAQLWIESNKLLGLLRS
jgi:hypothetical protein